MSKGRKKKEKKQKKGKSVKLLKDFSRKWLYSMVLLLSLGFPLHQVSMVKS